MSAQRRFRRASSVANEDLVYYTAWLLVHDKEFQSRHRNASPKAFPKGPLRFLIALALERHVRVSPTILSVALETGGRDLRRAGAADTRLVREVYELLDGFAVEPDDRAALLDACGAWLQRRSLKLGMELAGEALDRGDPGEAKSLLDRAQYRVEEAQESVKVSTHADEVLHQKRERAVVPTGLDDLDRAWRGGIRRAELGIMMAPTGVGKTMALCQLAVNAFWEGLTVLYYSFELTEDQVLERVLCGIVEKGRGEVVKKPWADLLARAIHDRGGVAPGDVEVRPPSQMSVADLKRDLDGYREKNGAYPDLLLLDSADDLTPNGKFDRTYEALRSTYTSLRLDIAQSLNIPVWTSSQTNKEGVEKARSSLKYVADAFAKAQRAHYVLGLAQTEQDILDLEGPFISVYVLKDSLHGTRGAWLKCRAEFGRGEDGYPRLEVVKSKGFSGARGNDD